MGEAEQGKEGEQSYVLPNSYLCSDVLPNLYVSPYVRSHVLPICMCAHMVSQIVCTLVCAIFVCISFFYNSITLSYTLNTILPSLGYVLGHHSGGAYATPSVWKKSSPPRLIVLLQGLLLLNPARCLIKRHYADNSKLSNITTTSNTMDTILLGLEYV